MTPIKREKTAAPDQPLTPLSYLQSPMVRIVVGEGDERKYLRAHHALLVQSPYFADACGEAEGDEVSYAVSAGWLPLINHPGE